MGLDTHICGECGSSFTDIQLFINHKQEGCSTDNVPDLQMEGIKKEVTDIHLEDGKIDGNLTGIIINSSDIVLGNEARETIESAGQTVQTLPDPTVKEIFFTLEKQAELPDVKPKRTGRKRGRPRKADVYVAENLLTNVEKPAVIDRFPIIKDGRCICSQCKKIFPKERHFYTHRCLAGGDYVDITKKQVLSDSEPEVIENDEIIHIDSTDKNADEQTGYNSSDDHSPKAKRGRKPIYHQAVDKNIDDEDNNEAIETVHPEGLEDGRGEPPTVVVELSNEMEVLADPAAMIEKSVIPRGHDSPMFETDDDKRKFEESLNVELSGIDHMFRLHTIEQDINDSVVSTSRGGSELTIYSCNTCDKVFKSLSHMRHHCLIHTNLKPFKCPKCSYTSNTKGNLYTHMRKHTGQYFYCKSCDFKSVNRSHVADHESIHSSERHKCEICQNDYSTLKSLINHVRKYHSSTKAGAEYLRQFLTRQTQCSVGAVLHQCHVCNRKFKKKIDRDRHLFVHNITVRSAFRCEVCDYTTTRRCYLEYHIKKHRVIYCCSLCTMRFISTPQLMQHLEEFHLAENCLQPSPEKNWSVLFDSCINISMFLPEADGTIDLLGKNYSSSATLNEFEDNECNVEMIEENIENGNINPNQGNSVIIPDNVDQTVVVMDIETAASNQAIENEGPESIDSLAENDAQQDNTNTMETEVIDDAVPLSTNDKLRLCLDDIYEKLNYQPMSKDILDKLKEQFGDSECLYCGRLFYNLTDLEQHILVHIGDKPFPCEKCDYRAMTKKALDFHIERFHEYVMYNCIYDDCSFVAVGRNQLWGHLQKHKLQIEETECPACDKKFTDKKKLAEHLLTQHPDVDKEEVKKLTQTDIQIHEKIGPNAYKCPYCERIFDQNSSELRHHILSHEFKVFKCETCGHTCNSSSNLKSHMLKHYNAKPFPCEYCDKMYKSKTALRWHIRAHKNGRMFKCDKCPYEAEQKSQLKKHSLCHSVLKRYKCDQCEFSTNSIGAVKIHINRYHENNIARPQTVDPKSVNYKLFKCLSCDSTFENMDAVRHHLKQEHQLELQDIDLLEPESPGVGGEANSAASTQFVQLNGNTLHMDQSAETFAALEALQYTEGTSEEKTASAVQILQQLIDMHQGIPAMGNQAIEAQDGNQMNSEAIIVQQENANDTSVQPTQFVVQYLNSDGLADFIPVGEIVLKP